MSENGTVTATEEENNSLTADATNEGENNSLNAEAKNNDSAADESTANTEDVSYHAVEKDGNVTAIWEMQGRKHLRTIDPRSGEGKQILALFETAA